MEGALPHGPSYHAHPRLYRKSVPKPMLNIRVTNAALQYQQVVTAFETQHSLNRQSLHHNQPLPVFW
jgi:hypothetical protein